MADFQMQRRDDFATVTIMARKGVTAARIGAALGVEAPTSPAYKAGSAGLALIGTGAGTWLAYADDETSLTAEAVRQSLADLASVSDQSGAYVIYRLSGTNARRLLQRGMAIDLDPAVFGVGAAATTVIAQVGVVVWMVDERPTYDVAVYRSFAESFRDWIELGVAAL